MHRIEAFEDDQLGPLRPAARKEFFEMAEIVMAENLPLRLGATDSLDHRIMVELIREDQAIGQKIADRGNRRQIGNPARSKDERRLLAVKASNSASSSTRRWWVPDILRVPPAPAPCRTAAAVIASITRGCRAMQRWPRLEHQITTSPIRSGPYH